MANNSKQNMASGKPDVQHVFIIGANPSVSTVDMRHL